MVGEFVNGTKHQQGVGPLKKLEIPGQREANMYKKLRTLQTIDGLGPTASNTVVLAIPIEVMDVLNGTARFLDGRRAQ